MQSAISIGSSILGAVLGRKLTSSRNVGRAVTAARGIGRAGSQKGDIARAEEDLKVQQEKLRDMERAFEDDVNELEATFAVDALEIDSIDVRPMKTDITIRDFGLCWTPWRVTSDGIAEPLWE
jgi:spore coat protein CotH